MPERHVFLSYARADGEEAARRLYDELHIAGAAAWLDVYDIPAGEDWNAEIDRALRSARMVVVLLTPAAVASRQVTAEWNEALSLGVPVVPVLIAECDVPRVLKTLNYIDFTRGYATGAAALRRRVRAPVADVAARRQRIDAGVAEARQAIVAGSERRLTGNGERVVGRPPSASIAYFRDREAARAQLGQLLTREPSVRLVSVIGRGGMGKTALACAVLAELESERGYPDDGAPIDGIVYLSTRTAGVSLERLYLDCARMLGGEAERSLMRAWTNAQLTLEERVERLLAALGGGRYVVLLDNLEDVLGDDGRIGDVELRAFLEASFVVPHGARLLITTRTPIAFGHEALRYDHRIVLDDGLPLHDGIALLREIDPSGQAGLRDAPDDALVRAVERVHGLPRALLVIGGMLKDDPFLTLDQLLDRFYEHDDVAEIIEAGYRRLDSASQHVMQALAILGRPADLVAIDFMLEPFEPDVDAAAAVRRLLGLYMVHADRAARTVSLHPVDRDIVYGSLPERGEYSRIALERRAADYYARLRLPPEQWLDIEAIEPQLLEFEHRLRAGEYDAAAAVLSEVDVAALIWHGHAARAQAMRARLEGRLDDPRMRMLQAYGLGHAHLILGPLVEARAHFENAAALARQIGDVRIEQDAAGFLGETCRRIGEHGPAVEQLARTVAAHRERGDARSEAWWLLLLGLAHAFSGDAAAALADGRRALALATGLGDREVQGRGHGCVALAHLLLDAPHEAIHHAREAARLYREANWRDSVGYALNVEGLALLQLRRMEPAAERFDEVRALGREEGQPRIEGLGLYNGAQLERMRGRTAEALKAATAAVTALHSMGAAEAESARSLVEALEAHQRGDAAAEARALLAAARSSTPDLVDARRLAEEAGSIARVERLDALAEQAASFLGEPTARSSS